MMMNTLFGQDLFNDFFNDSFKGYNPFLIKEAASVMKTDIKDADSNYEMDIELPGYTKADIQAKLEKGYLTITANHVENKDEQDKNGKYIRRERYAGTCSRSFFVGEDLQEEDIKAKFENGILKLVIPKEVPKQIEPNKYIAIEG